MRIGSGSLQTQRNLVAVACVFINSNRYHIRLLSMGVTCVSYLFRDMYRRRPIAIGSQKSLMRSRSKSQSTREQSRRSRERRRRLQVRERAVAIFGTKKTSRKQTGLVNQNEVARELRTGSSDVHCSRDKLTRRSLSPHNSNL